MKEQQIGKKQSGKTDIEVERVNCPRCNTNDSKVILKGGDFLYGVPGEFFVSECSKCGLWFQNPRPAASSLGKLYPDNYSPHAKAAHEENIPEFKRKYLRQELGYTHLQSEKIESFDWRSLRFFNWLKGYFFGTGLTPFFVPGGTLLEIGCASGARLVKLRNLGWTKLFGIELVPDAVEKARAEGFNVECGMIEDKIDTYPDSYFDVIITSMVVEHLFNPFDVFERITKKLKPGGQLLFSTVVRDSIDGKIFAEQWAGFDFPRHMVYFRKEDLLGALRANFVSIKCFHQNAPVDFKRSSAWRISIGKGNIADKLLVRIADSSFFKFLTFPFAWLGLTTRISVHAIKKNPATVQKGVKSSDPQSV